MKVRFKLSQIISSVSNYHGFQIRIADIKSLDDGMYLNDVIIDFYLKYLQVEKLSKHNQRRTHVFGTFFFTVYNKDVDLESNVSIESQRHGFVRKWTKNVNILEKDFIFIPINQL